MQCKIGLPFWYGTAKTISDLDALFKFLKNNDICFLELSIDYPWPYRDKDLLDKVFKTAQKHGLELGIHAPWRDIFLASTYSKIRASSLETVIESLIGIEYAQVSYIVLHVTTMQKQILEGIKNESIEAARESIKRIKDIVKGISGEPIDLCIENLSVGLSSSAQDIQEIITDLDACLAFDIAHAASLYSRYYRSYYNSFYEYLEDYVNMVLDIKTSIIHFHDIRLSDLKEHIIPGHGDLDYKRVLKIVRKLKPSYILIEAFNDRNGKHLTPIQTLNECREFITWTKIYLS
ncbi:MAG: sugar phosphate isomerase/epimerase [Desulfurococcales archaeon]|nr:sugar phosphate isomerase/epimerase [Desulfurococcales archaeon]